MSAEKSYLQFDEVPATLKTRAWQVLSATSQERLAEIRWHGAWRKYVLRIEVRPNLLTIFDANCLREITSFLDEQNAAHKTLLAERKAQ